MERSGNLAFTEKALGEVGLLMEELVREGNNGIDACLSEIDDFVCPDSENLGNQEYFLELVAESNGKTNYLIDTIRDIDYYVLIRGHIQLFVCYIGSLFVVLLVSRSGQPNDVQETLKSEAVTRLCETIDELFVR